MFWWQARDLQYKVTMRNFFVVILLTFLCACKKEKDVQVKDTPSDFLSDLNYNTMKVELAYVSGMRPTDGTIAQLTEFLNKRLNKPAGIDIVTKEIPSPGLNSYTVEDLGEIEKNYRSEKNAGKLITAWIFYADNDYSSDAQNAKVLGVAYGPSSMAVFEKTVREYSGGLTQPDRTLVESTVSQHEFGHVLGLVNNGTAATSDHQDTAHGSHCKNTKCLMYYATETSDLIANILGKTVPTLDEDCMNDLRKAGGK